MKHGRIHLTWENPHDGQRRHVECHACSGLELVLVQPGATADDVAWAAGGFDDEAIVVEAFEDVADDLANGLEGGEIVFGLLVAGYEAFHVFSHAFQPRFGFAVFSDLGPASQAIEASH